MFVVGLIGTLFVTNKEPAFAAHKMCQSLSTFTLFATAPYLCTKVKILTVGAVLCFAVAGYTTLEVRQRLARAEEMKDKLVVESMAEKKSDNGMQHSSADKADIVKTFN